MGTFMHASEGEMVCTSTNVKIPYFNAPIYLENKTAVGKVDEILGPINQVYFTIKPQEGIVATSFKNGDKFFIGGDKLLPLERYIFSRRTYCNTYLTYSLDSCPSPSPLPVLPRSRSPPVEEASLQEVHLAAEEVSVIVEVVADVEDSLRVADPALEEGVDREAVSEETEVVVEVSPRAVALALVAEVAVVVVEATKCLASHLDTQKGAKHEGVNRQRRHGVMKPMDGLGKWFRKEAVHLHVLRCTGLHFEIQRQEESAKKTISTFIRLDYILMCVDGSRLVLWRHR
jgi:rRNA processing protein Gar1